MSKITVSDIVVFKGDDGRWHLQVWQTNGQIVRRVYVEGVWEDEPQANPEG
jgi:hypothetical protein